MTCEVCDRRFNKYRSELRKTTGDKHFCSPACWYSFNQRDNHYLWGGGQDDRMCPEGRIWRRAVMKRDKGFCRICHANERLEAHHIKPFRDHPAERWELSNGITLCRPCHDKIGRREMDYADVLAAITQVDLVVWHVEPEQAGDTATPS